MGNWKSREWETGQGQEQEQEMGNGNGEVAYRICGGRDDSELRVILFMNRTKDDLRLRNLILFTCK